MGLLGQAWACVSGEATINTVATKATYAWAIARLGLKNDFGKQLQQVVGSEIWAMGVSVLLC
jgi:hypothetical protein